MKSLFLSALTLITSMASMSAEEGKRALLVEETFFGSNPAAYALLRTETETTASDGFLRRRTWMDEYAKEPVLLDDYSQRDGEEVRIRHGAYQSKLTQSTLILDVTIPRNRESDIKASGNTAAANGANQNSPITLAAMLLRYPNRMLTRWSPAQREQLVQNGFFTTSKRRPW